MKKLFLSSFFAAALLIGGGSVAQADSLGINFEPSLYGTGSINGQDGWSATGPYDQSVVAAPTISGTQSLRISNAITSGSFGDWIFSKSLVDEAGETLAENGGFSAGVRKNHFVASWDFMSADPTQEQIGLQVSTSPDRGDGARMSFVRLKDTSTGLLVEFSDYQTGSGFVITPVASGLDRTVSHNIRIEMDFVNGMDNDIVKVYVDNGLAHTGTSWEGYFNNEEGNPTRTVDSMLFQARTSGGTALGTLGKGFLIDNLTLTSSTPIGPATNKDQCKNDGWKLFNNPTYKNQGQCVSATVNQSKNR